MSTVFDVAAELIQRSGGPMSALKLQKLCFYAFGWYAHLTGEPLFDERFYAMKFGPVVGELLSAHAGQKQVGLDTIAVQREARQDEISEIDPYKEAVIDAVWDEYGGETAKALVDMTHREAIWKDSWDSRAAGTGRASLPTASVISYFLSREPRHEESIELPPVMVSCVDQSELDALEQTAHVHSPFVDHLRSLTVAS